MLKGREASWVRTCAWRSEVNLRCRSLGIIYSSKNKTKYRICLWDLVLAKNAKTANGLTCPQLPASVLAGHPHDHVLPSNDSHSTSSFLLHLSTPLLHTQSKRPPSPARLPSVCLLRFVFFF